MIGKKPRKGIFFIRQNQFHSFGHVRENYENVLFNFGTFNFGSFKNNKTIQKKKN